MSQKRIIELAKKSKQPVTRAQTRGDWNGSQNKWDEKEKKKTKPFRVLTQNGCKEVQME